MYPQSKFPSFTFLANWRPRNPSLARERKDFRAPNHFEEANRVDREEPSAGCWGRCGRLLRGGVGDGELKTGAMMKEFRKAGSDWNPLPSKFQNRDAKTFEFCGSEYASPPLQSHPTSIDISHVYHTFTTQGPPDRRLCQCPHPQRSCQACRLCRQ
jgi:hypothetical protein